MKLFFTFFGTLLFLTSGAQWNSLTSGTSSDLSSACFFDNDTGLVGGTTVIRKTTNGGSTWATTYSNSNTSIEKITKTLTDTFYACGQDLASTQSLMGSSKNRMLKTI